VSAPGVDILSLRAADTTLGTAVNDKYIRLFGTSMACPHAVGVLALLASRYPSASNAFLVAQLKRGAVNIDGLNAATYRGKLGAGRIDAYRSLSNTVDLVMDSIVPNAAGTTNGGTLSVTDTVRNQGTVSSGPFTISYRLSRNAVWGDADDISIPTTRALSLEAGAAGTATTVLSIPSNTPAGEYWVLAKADDVQEPDATNNLAVSAQRVSVAIQPVDLLMTQVSFTATTVNAGGSVALTTAVRNQGTAPAGPFAIGFRLSRNRVWGDDDDVTIPATRTVAALAGSASNIATATLAVPASVPGGTYYVLARADAGEAVPETDESNNVLSSESTLTIPLADLTVTALSTTARGVGRGETFAVTATVKNQGGGGSGAFRVRFVLSADTLMANADDVALSPEWRINGLAAGAAVSITLTVTVPADSPAGYLNLGAIADPDNAVAETRENNNTKSYAYKINVH
jgi:hypothetical protein